MGPFKFDPSRPQSLLFRRVDQVDVPRLRGDFGCSPATPPLVATLRPGIY